MDGIEDSTFERDLSPVARLLAAHDLPSPSEMFLQKLSSEVNRDDVSKMKEAQEHMLQRFEKTNEMLLNFNALSLTRYETTAKDFKHHTQLLADMKKDLNNVFKRIRALKTQLNQQFPESFKAACDQRTLSVPEEEEESTDVGNISDSSTPTRQVSEPSDPSTGGSSQQSQGQQGSSTIPRSSSKSKNERVKVKQKSKTGKSGAIPKIVEPGTS